MVKGNTPIAPYSYRNIASRMRVGERIAEQRVRCGLSQSQLAREVGVSQGTIGKLESGITAGSSHLHKIARVLKTTAEYLSGETDDPTSDTPDIHLTADEAQLLQKLRSLSADDRAMILQLTRKLACR